MRSDSPCKSGSGLLDSTARPKKTSSLIIATGKPKAVHSRNPIDAPFTLRRISIVIGFTAELIGVVIPPAIELSGMRIIRHLEKRSGRLISLTSAVTIPATMAHAAKSDITIEMSHVENAKAARSRTDPPPAHLTKVESKSAGSELFLTITAIPNAAKRKKKVEFTNDSYTSVSESMQPSTRSKRRPINAVVQLGKTRPIHIANMNPSMASVILPASGKPSGVGNRAMKMPAPMAATRNTSLCLIESCIHSCLRIHNVSRIQSQRVTILSTRLR